MGITLTHRVIESVRSSRGGWNQEQLAILGVPWPPIRGWKANLIGKEITVTQYIRLRQLAGRLKKGHKDCPKKGQEAWRPVKNEYRGSSEVARKANENLKAYRAARGIPERK